MLFSFPACLLFTNCAAPQAAERILAEEDAAASRAAAEGGGEGGGEGAASGADALMEMGKLNTARIRKAVDPKILDVKKRVRAARRSLKRESKVVLSDEIIFFDDVAGNEQAKVRVFHHLQGVGLACQLHFSSSVMC
jgi:hypothetical protein